MNDEPTPLDDLAMLVVHGRAAVVLPPAVEAALASLATDPATRGTGLAAG